LNVLVAGKQRGKGIGSKLMKTLLAGSDGIWFLEVRESNAAARALYKSLGFSDFGRRKGYYQKPYEDAIVMRFCS
jgi:ribosomal-protein-alanine N-acetyltransferase